MAKRNGKRPHYPERDREVFNVLRAIKGMSAPELSRKTFLSPSTIYKMRRAHDGTRYPRHLTLAALARVAGMKYELVPIEAGEKVEL